ncbi:MAG TPA: DNA-3-methyladenine glycosylase [Nitrososphaeraceae archaeon]|jgi:DNA-3-methyladenine glycosylase|nr:DNA-3-methyladenine glycosylase [Nitrososphaeraceae archaeon]
MKQPDLDFYSRDTENVARELLGKKLVRMYDDGSGKLQRLSGTIYETEAYGSKNDPASHAFNGRTNRNSVMYGDVGKAYVYFIYGMHHCMNVTAHATNSNAGAVLIRSLIPIEGIGTMIYLSNIKNKLNLINGPGRLTKALDINRSHNGLNLTDKRSILHIANGIKPKKVISTTRIGISRATEKYWRYLIAKE